jgi:CubicO group peptidase (beta-lactamase class C family)
MSVSRRVLLAGLGALATAARARTRLLAEMPNPAMLSAGVIARNRRGRIVLREADGVVFGSGARFSPEAPFRVASVSKMVTTFAFMRLVRAGRIGLDDDVTRIIGDGLRHPLFPEIAVTPRLLLSHQSGLRNGDDYPVRFGDNLTERLAAARGEPRYGGWYAPAGEAPGRYFTYADVNTTVIATIMEKITGQRFDAHMRETLFAPHGLDLGYNWSGVSQKKRDRAAPAARNFDGVWTVQVDGALPPAPQPLLNRAPHAADRPLDDYKPGENGFAFAPHGGLRLSLSDMDELARILRDGSEDMAVPQWTSDGTNGATENGFYGAYGLCMQRPGFGALDRFFGTDSQDWRGHSGDAYGWMTGLYWNARDGRSIVFALNGMQEFDRPRATRSALTPHEQALIDRALARIG